MACEVKFDPRFEISNAALSLHSKEPSLNSERPPRVPRRGQQPRDRQRQQPQSLPRVLRAQPLLRVHEKYVRLGEGTDGQAEQLKLEVL